MAKSAGSSPTAVAAAAARQTGRAVGLALLVASSIAPARAAETPCSAAPTSGVPLATGTNGPVMGDEAPVILAGIALIPPDAAGPEGWHEGLAADGALEPFRFQATAPADRYGRLAGLVFDAEGALLQAALVAEGRAIVRPDDVEEACARALLALESAARSAGSGLWGDSSNIAKATDAASLLARNGLYVLVEGRIVSVGYGSRMVFLDFGRSFRTDFTVLVPETLVSRLREAGFPVESLEGRTVRVRGIIEESGGPAIRLASPLALELVDVME